MGCFLSMCCDEEAICSHVFVFFPELVTIQSAEENDFIINYSPHVWKGQINVWLGMFYDTDSKYYVTT